MHEHGEQADDPAADSIAPSSQTRTLSSGLPELLHLFLCQVEKASYLLSSFLLCKWEHDHNRPQEADLMIKEHGAHIALKSARPMVSSQYGLTLLPLAVRPQENYSISSGFTFFIKK